MLKNLSLKDLKIGQNMKVKGTQKYKFFKSLVNLKKFGSTI